MEKKIIIPASLERRLALYYKTNELSTKGFSNAEISKELGVDVDQVRRWVRGEKPKRVHRYEPDLSPGKDLAYVAGFYLGDGKDAGDEHKVRFELADKEQLEHVGGLVAKILGREAKPLGRDGTFFIVDYDSVILSVFLNQPLERLVAHFRGFESDFLRGFFDAEGYASCSVDSKKMTVSKFCVGVANTQLTYLQSVKTIFEQFAIRSVLRRTNKAGESMTIRGRTWIRRNDVYHLVVTGGVGIKTFRKTVGFHNPAKAQKLKDLVRLIGMRPDERYVWFQTRYERRGRKWVKIDESSPI